MRLRLAAAICTALGVAAAQSRPAPPPGGFALQFDLTVPVSYSDGYQTFGSMILPAVPPPPSGWPLVVFVHPFGSSRGSDFDFQQVVAGQGHAVWSYDVRGHGQAQLANVGHVAGASTLWGPIERLDLAEQILFVGQQPNWQGVVDANRVAVTGISQGGAHAWQAAAFAQTTVSVPGRPAVVFPQIRCVVAQDLVADPIDDWLRGGSAFSTWFVEAISGSYQGVPIDAGFLQTCRTAFLAQDPASLAASFAAEGRAVAPQLASTSVPVLHCHAYFDNVSSPLTAVERFEAMFAPHRALLGTVGHAVPHNEFERAFRHSTALRWLFRYLWEEVNEVDIESPFLLAEMPLSAAERDDPQHVWSRAHAQDLTPTPSATRFHLHDDFGLHQLAPATPQLGALVEHTIAPTATSFTPVDYLDQPTVRELANVLAAAPLDELVYSTTLATSAQLRRSASLHLRLLPEQAQWQLGVSLTVQPAGAAAEEVAIANAVLAGHSSSAGVPENRELRLPPIAVRLPAGATLRLYLRNLALRDPPLSQGLEVAPLFQPFRVGVVHGVEPDGSWLDLPLEPIEPRLVVARPILPLATGDPLVGTIRGGVERAGLPYFATVGLSGQLPSVRYLNADVPVEGDWLVVASAGSSAAPHFQGFLGFLDAAGEASCTFDLTSVAPLPQLLNGWQLTFAAFVWDAQWGNTGAASNPCDVLLR